MKADTLISGVTTFLAMSKADRTAKHAPRLCPVHVMLTFSFLYLPSNSLIRSKSCVRALDGMNSEFGSLVL
ncbi:hypothetical protein HanIR_Chr02g0060951 [Helianthus annuus]|nr:hypothetical protein HanIR_Chr02g0060951 [Helianthus annuus]